MSGINVTLHFPENSTVFPDDDQTVEMPAVPRIGDTIEWTGLGGYSEWVVTKVAWVTSDPGQFHGVGLHLAPAADRAEK